MYQFYFKAHPSGQNSYTLIVPSKNLKLEIALVQKVSVFGIILVRIFIHSD